MGSCNGDGFGGEIFICEAFSHIFFTFYFTSTLHNYYIALSFCDASARAYQRGLLNMYIIKQEVISSSRKYTVTAYS